MQPSRNSKLLNVNKRNNFNDGNKNQIKFIMSTGSNFCTNHLDKTAEFKIVI